MNIHTIAFLRFSHSHTSTCALIQPTLLHLSSTTNPGSMVKGKEKGKGKKSGIIKSSESPSSARPAVATSKKETKNSLKSKSLPESAQQHRAVDLPEDECPILFDETENPFLSPDVLSPFHDGDNKYHWINQYLRAAEAAFYDDPFCGKAIMDLEHPAFLTEICTKMDKGNVDEDAWKASM